MREQRPQTSEQQEGEWQQSFEVRGSPIQGSGAFATRRIRAGQQIAEYTGEVVDADTAYTRYQDDNMFHHHTFLFSLEDGTFIDAGSTGGNEARYINHSCDPNSEAYEDDGRLLVRALKNIQPGTEITYDYRLEREGKPKKSWLRLYACRCGAKNCRGTMLLKPPKLKGGKKKGKNKGKKK
ncbi:MAG: SET domain-containing protein-lysine N-methyltransferase [bacterium]|nr:SET domain-containing protein-lysine N-methyltransferase [bacterium]